MDRVTDEWLREADTNAQASASEKFPSDFLSNRWVCDLRLAFAQSIARECVRIAKEVETEPTITQMLDHWGAETVAERIRARFGLEDDRG